MVLIHILVCGCHACPHQHFAAIGKLNGIAHQIEQYLPQAQFIALDPYGDLTIHPTDQFNLFIKGLSGQSGTDTP